MKAKILSLLFFVSTISVFAQNLVPNPSFETDDTGYVFCGIYLEINFNNSVSSWYTPTHGTPDLFSTHIDQSCFNFQPNSTYGGPIGLKGPQLPRTGHVMAGMFCYSINGLNQREYVQSPLLSPLIPGNMYYVEFYASLADNTEKYLDKLGAYLSDSAAASLTDEPLNFTPQIISSVPVSDTSQWTKISGTFQATSANNFITIGNFSGDAATTVYANPGSAGLIGGYGAYYFIDDVAVIDLTTGIEKIQSSQEINVYPNPATDLFNISSNSDVDLIFTISDLASKKIMEGTFRNGLTVSTEKFAPGTYFYEIKNKTTTIKNGKIVILR